MPINKPLSYSPPSPISVTQPQATDASALHALVARCPPLDRNSLYCNLLQCTHFAPTCALARRAGRVVGFVSGYRPPAAPEVLFIWQVAVDPAARGESLARRMILAILARPDCRAVRRLHTTVTSSNRRSVAMFSRLALDLGAALATTVHFDRHVHLAGRNETENLLDIGPFTTASVQRASDKSVTP